MDVNELRHDGSLLTSEMIDAGVDVVVNKFEFCGHLAARSVVREIYEAILRAQIAGRAPSPGNGHGSEPSHLR